MAYRSRLLTILKPKGFDPLSLNPTILARPSNSFSRTGGQFTAASSQYLNVASNSDLQIADNETWGSCWVYFDDTTGTKNLWNKWGGADYEFIIQSTVNGFYGLFRNAANTANINLNDLFSISSGTWYHVFWFHSGIENIVGFIINGRAVKTASLSGGVRVTTFQMELGRGDGSNYHNGRIDNVLFGKPPASLGDGTSGSLAHTIATALFNSNNGLAFQDITAQQETDWGIVSGWLDNSLTADAFGSNTLTNSGGVTQAAGKVNAVAVDNDPTYFVNTIGDTDFIQNTLANRPFYRTANKGFWQYDGTNDVLSFVNPIAVALPVSCYVVVDTTNLGSDDRILLDRSPAAVGSPAFYLGAAGTGSYKPYIYWNGDRVTGSAIQAKQIVRWKLTSTNAYLKQNGNAEIDGGAHGQTLGSVDWTAIGNNGTQQPDMDLYEFLLFNGIDLSSDDDAAIFDYLNTKHSVY